MHTTTDDAVVAIWVEEGWAERDARSWLEAGFRHPGEPDGLGSAVDPVWIRHHARTARDWFDVGIPAALAAPWRGIVDDPHEATLWALAGHTALGVALLYDAVHLEIDHRHRTGEPLPYAPLDWVTVREEPRVIRAGILAGYTPQALADLRDQTGHIDIDGLQVLGRYRHHG